MAVKVIFEFGHTAKLKSKKTPDGFTHDWELYVRGYDKTDISHFVERVVFNLHHSFPKPKRAIKEPPYALKESGYGGFIIPIDIYLKNRDEPKKITFNYDLELQQIGTKYKTETKKHVFNNPSEEFRRKLLKGGGIVIVNNTDDRSRESLDERSQAIAKTKPNIEPIRKYKMRPEDAAKSQTFATLFGEPITKTAPKISPDPKNKVNQISGSNTNKNSKINEKILTNSVSSTAKDKNDKIEKKDKYKHSPHKDKNEIQVKESKRQTIEEKYEKREEKKKDKLHAKEQIRNKEKLSKRPPSPKRIQSPKRLSPARTTITGVRGEDNGQKFSNKHNQIETIMNNNVAEKSNSLNSNVVVSNKKAKKDKRSHEKEKEREKKDKDRDKKGKDDRSNTSTPVILGSTNTFATNINSKQQNSDFKFDENKKENPIKEPKDLRKVSLGSRTPDIVPTLSDKKVLEKHDKDTDKKHKHKKKEKTKDKDREKEQTSKEKKKEKTIKQKDDVKKYSETQGVSGSTSEAIIPTQKTSTLNSFTTLRRDLSSDDSSESEVENSTHTLPEKVENTENSNSSVPDTNSKTQTINLEKISKNSEKKERKEKSKLEKDEKKRKRKSKNDIEAQVRKNSSPANLINSDTPPTKNPKKEEILFKNGDKSNSPLIPLSSTHSQNVISSQITVSDASTFRTPLTPPPINVSGAGTNSQRSLYDEEVSLDYMSELRDLQHKIMTLQDSNDLQQVVEMIAATGRFEVTSKTFDFDLCALDRHTVQRLQQFFATSCS